MQDDKQRLVRLPEKTLPAAARVVLRGLAVGALIAKDQPGTTTRQGLQTATAQTDLCLGRSVDNSQCEAALLLYKSRTVH